MARGRSITKTNTNMQQQGAMSQEQGPPMKRQKREAYRNSLQVDSAELPKKKFYRQRAHANPFSDHSLT